MNTFLTGRKVFLNNVSRTSKLTSFNSRPIGLSWFRVWLLGRVPRWRHLLCDIRRVGPYIRFLDLWFRQGSGCMSGVYTPISVPATFLGWSFWGSFLCPIKSVFCFCFVPSIRMLLVLVDCSDVFIPLVVEYESEWFSILFFSDWWIRHKVNLEKGG